MIEVEEAAAGYSVVQMVRGIGNALNIDLVAALIDTLGRLEHNPAVRAVVLTGQGSAFGAGVDLLTLVEGGAEYVRKFLPLLNQLFERLAIFPKPLVAAINGYAIAGGAIIALAADQRLMARGVGRMGLTEVHVGVVFPAWALEIARFAMPPHHFPKVTCTGRTFDPEAALACGLVDELVEPDKLLDRAREVAMEFAAIPAASFTATKQAVRHPMIETARRRAEWTDDAVLDHWTAPATLQGIADFAERTFKRKP